MMTQPHGFSTAMSNSQSTETTTTVTRRLTRLAGLFSKIDTDCSGTIDRAELAAHFRSIGIRVSRIDLDEFFGDIDVNSNGQLEFDEFVELMTVQKLRTVFDEIDTDCSGYLDRDEISEAFKKLGLSLDDEQVDVILRSIDKDGNFQIDFEEFQIAFDGIPYVDFGKIAQHWCHSLMFDTGTDLSPAQPVQNLQVFCAGAFSGIIARTVIAPLSLVVIRSQTTNSGSSFKILKDVLRQGGVRGLFKGNLMAVLRVVPFGGLVGIFYRNLLHYLPSPSKTWEPFRRLAAGATAGMAATIPLYPLDLIRARLSVNNFRIGQVFREITIQHGIRGFYHGLSPTLKAVVPFVACQQTTYDMLKKQSEKTDLQPNFRLFLMFGVLSGLISQTCIHPFDLLRRRSQVSVSKVGMWSSMKSIVRSNGYRGLFRGLVPACIKVMPAVAVSLLVRDYTLDYLEFR